MNIIISSERINGFFRCFLLIIFVSFFLPFDTKGQPQVMFKRYDVQDGLSHNYVRSILQDSEGFIWLATEDGLNKFNGYSFKVYKNIPGDTTSISKHPILAIAEDENQNIWLGTWGGGLIVYNRKLDNFRRIKHHPNNSNSPSSDYIYTINKGTKGRIWVGTNGSGFDMIDTKKSSITHFTHDPTNPNSVSSNRVMAFTEDRKGNLWIGTIGGGVNRLDINTNLFYHYRHKEGDEKSLSHDDVYSIYYDSKDRLWVGTWNFGLNLMEDPKQGFVHFEDQPGNSKSTGNNQIWAIAENSDKEIWIGTDNGLALFQEKDKSFIVFRNDSFDPKSLVANSVKSLFADKQNRLWIGTYNNGICMFDKRFVQMGHYYRKQNGHSLSYNDVSAFLEIDKEVLLIGTDGGGLNVFNRNKNHFSTFQHDNKNPKSIGGNKIKAMLMDSKKRIWITFWGAGMDLFNPDTKTFTHFRKGSKNSPEGLNNENVTCITEDRDGILWLGTFGGGLNKFDANNMTFRTFDHNVNHPIALGDSFIWSLITDKDNNVWAGTSNGKIYMLDHQRKNFKEIPLKKASEDGYAIMVLYEDSKQRIWVGLEGGGLKMLDRGKLTTTTITQADGLPSNNINAIEEDNSGNLWISTNQGIVQYNPENKKIRTFEVSDGLQGLNFNRQASAVLSTGELLFGGNNGFNMFHPDSLLDREIHTPLVFTDFQIFNKRVPIGEEDSPLKFQINKTKSIRLSYKQTVFSIEYAGLNYSAPEKLKYKYRLKGFTDESWQNVGSARRVTYTNLNPGTYVFEVDLDESDKTLSSAKTLSIIIEPPWWKTGFARMLFVVISSSFLFLIYYIRSRNIILQNKKLEREVDDRTRQLTEANAALRELNVLIHEQKEEIESQALELAESNEEIKAINHLLEERVELRTTDLIKSNQELDNFVYRVSHDIRAPLSSILGLIALIEKENNSEVTNAYLKMVNKSVNKLDGFVKDILDYSRNSRMEIVRKEIDFKELIDATSEELQYMENAHKLETVTELDIKFPHYNDSRRLHIILRNLFSNAIKYQNLRNEKSYLMVKIVSDKEGATITVSDNGIGIDKLQIEKVFNMFYRGSDKSTGSGLGLYIVKEAVEKLDGTIDIQSEIGAGTVFTIYLPNINTII